MPSGLDDYPRAKLNGKQLVEGHLDLQSWIIVLSRTMIKIYNFLNSPVEFKERIFFWSNFNNKVEEILINQFWDETNNKFDDFFIDEKGTKQFSGHTGYLQLFPLILNVFNNTKLKQGNLTDSKYINESLNILLIPNQGLRTNYGIRSLSLNDLSYKKGQNYWTSPIWININYLIIRFLYNLKNQPAYSYLEKEYREIRESVVDNMVRNFEENGYIWEVYNDLNGNGMYNHPFTGWSALVVNLIYELF